MNGARTLVLRVSTGVMIGEEERCGPGAVNGPRTLVLRVSTGVMIGERGTVVLGTGHDPRARVLLENTGLITARERDCRPLSLYSTAARFS